MSLNKGGKLRKSQSHRNIKGLITTTREERINNFIYSSLVEHIPLEVHLHYIPPCHLPTYPLPQVHSSSIFLQKRTCLTGCQLNIDTTGKDKMKIDRNQALETSRLSKETTKLSQVDKRLMISIPLN